MKHCIIIVMIIACLAVHAVPATAGVPQLLNYQGRVVVNGTNHHGSGEFKFALIDQGTNISRRAAATCMAMAGEINSVSEVWQPPHHPRERLCWALLMLHPSYLICRGSCWKGC